MKHSTIFVPVKCSEREPSRNDFYKTDIGIFPYNTENKVWLGQYAPINPTIWYEEQHDKIVLSEEQFVILVDKNAPKTVEECRAYLISEGLDPDQIIKEGLQFIEELKAKINRGE